MDEKFAVPESIREMFANGKLSDTDKTVLQAAGIKLDVEPVSGSNAAGAVVNDAQNAAFRDLRSGKAGEATFDYSSGLHNVESFETGGSVGNSGGDVAGLQEKIKNIRDTISGTKTTKATKATKATEAAASSVSGQSSDTESSENSGRGSAEFGSYQTTGGDIVVDVQAIESACRELQLCNEAIQTDLEYISTLFGGLSQYWSGNAASFVREAFQTHMSKAMPLRKEVMDDVVNYLRDTVAGNYQNAEQTNIRIADAFL